MPTPINANDRVTDGSGLYGRVLKKWVNNGCPHYAVVWDNGTSSIEHNLLHETKPVARVKEMNFEY